MRGLRTVSTLVIGLAAVAATVATPAYASAGSGHAAPAVRPAAASAPSSHVVAVKDVPGGQITVVVENFSRGAKTIPPRSDSGCVGNLEWNNIQTCIYITGQSTYVSDMTAKSFVYNYPVLEHVHLSGPSVDYNTLDYWIDQGQFLGVEWTPNRNIIAGSYCATSWEANGSGGYTNQGTACQPVHP